MRILLVGAVLALGCVSAQAQAFGFRMGDPIPPGAERRNPTSNQWRVVPPQPSPLFGGYTIVATVEDGVCQVSAVTGFMKPLEAIVFFRDVEARLVELYGRTQWGTAKKFAMDPVTAFGELVEAGGFDLDTVWTADPNAPLPVGLSSVVLSIGPVDENNVTVINGGLHYMFDNFDLCPLKMSAAGTAL